jgi:hypothetical protein
MVAKGQSEKPKASRTKRKKPEAFVSKTGVEVKENYCRKCRRMRSPGEFFSAVDGGYLDTNGIMSICKDCMSDTYVRMFQSEHTIERTILRLCRLFNIRYSVDAINAATAHLKTQNKLPDDPTAFGIYKAKLMATQKTGLINKDTSEDFTFVEVERPANSNRMDDDEAENAHDLKQFWGENYSYDDFQFLEKKLAEWEDSYSHSTKAEVFILKELCHRELELRNARQLDRAVDPILKSMQSLLNDGGLKPIQAKAADSGKVHDTWGTLIRQIEETTPAEFYKEKDLFKNFDGIIKYINNYLIRSLKNFVVSGSRDFNIVDDDNDEDEIPVWEDENGNESSSIPE